MSGEKREKELVARWATARDEAAFRELVEMWKARAMALALWLLRELDAAEEAVQRAFIRMAQRPEKYDSTRPFAPFFKTVVVNEARKVGRSLARIRRRERSAAMRRPEILIADPSNHVERVWLEERIDRLPLVLRQMVRLHFMHGFTHRKLARAFQCSKATVARRIKNGLSMMRRDWFPRVAS